VRRHANADEHFRSRGRSNTSPSGQISFLLFLHELLLISFFF
jgi:hypothetical protein